MGWGTTSRDRVSVAAESDGEQRLTGRADPVPRSCWPSRAAGRTRSRSGPGSRSSEEITSCAPTITVFDGAGNVQDDLSRGGWRSSPGCRASPSWATSYGSCSSRLGPRT